MKVALYIHKHIKDDFFVAYTNNAEYSLPHAYVYFRDKYKDLPGMTLDSFDVYEITADVAQLVERLVADEKVEGS